MHAAHENFHSFHEALQSSQGVGPPCDIKYIVVTKNQMRREKCAEYSRFYFQKRYQRGAVQYSVKRAK